jgi:hypothetical protein
MPLMCLSPFAGLELMKTLAFLAIGVFCASFYFTICWELCAFSCGGAIWAC